MNNLGARRSYVNMQGGSNEESNLWLACPICNSDKAGKIEAIDPLTNEVVALFNLRTQKWSEHVAWSVDGICLIGKTVTGRVTMKALGLDNDYDFLEVRSYWVQAVCIHQMTKFIRTVLE